MHHCSILIVIPTYNEKENIALLLRTIFELNLGYHVLVVDDSSPDGTANKVLQLKTVYPEQLFVLIRPRKDGLGKAYVAGFSWALRYNYDYVCSMDADFSHAPVDIARLLSACIDDHGDVAIGSRYVLGGRLINWTFKRTLYSRIANYIAKLVMDLPIKDATAGLVCYRCDLLRDLMRNIVSTGYSFQIEMKFLAYKRGVKIIEIPITFIDRTKGKSKLYIKDALKGFWDLLLVRWRIR